MARTTPSITPEGIDYQPPGPPGLIRCCYPDCAVTPPLGFPFCSPHYELMSGGEKITESKPLYEASPVKLPPNKPPSRPSLVGTESSRADPEPAARKRKRLSGIKLRKTAPGAALQPSSANYGALPFGRDARPGARASAERLGDRPGIYSPPISPSHPDRSPKGPGKPLSAWAAGVSSRSGVNGLNGVGRPMPETPKRPHAVRRDLKQERHVDLEAPAPDRYGKGQRVFIDLTLDQEPELKKDASSVSGLDDVVFGSGSHASVNRPLQEWFVSKWDVGSELADDFITPNEISPSHRRSRPTAADISAGASKTPQLGRRSDLFSTKSSFSPPGSTSPRMPRDPSGEPSGATRPSLWSFEDLFKRKGVLHSGSKERVRTKREPTKSFQPSFDTWVYSQEGAALPPEGVVLGRRPDDTPDQTSTLFAHVDPRIHWNLPRPQEWYEAKQAEIKKRGGRKANFGKAAQRMARARVAPVPLEDRVPEYVRENPAWMRAMEWFDECDRRDREGEPERPTATSGLKERARGLKKS